MPANAASLLLLSWENNTTSLALHMTNRLLSTAKGELWDSQCSVAVGTCSSHETVRY